MRTRPIPFDQFRRDYLLPMCEFPLRAIATKREMVHVLNLVAELGVKTTADLTTGLIARACESVPPGQSPRALQKHLRLLRVMANFAVCNGWLKVSPFTVRPLRAWVPRIGPPAPKKWFPAADVRRVLDLLQEDCQTTAGWARWKAYRLWAVTNVVALAGLRATEALTLEIADVSLDRRIIDITARRRLKTNSSCAPVPMCLALVTVLRTWLEVLPEHPVDFPIPANVPWLFPNVTRCGPWLHGSPGTKPRDRLQAVSARAGVPGMTFQSLRAAWATRGEPGSDRGRDRRGAQPGPGSRSRLRSPALFSQRRTTGPAAAPGQTTAHR